MAEPVVITCPDCSGIGHDGGSRCPICWGKCKVEVGHQFCTADRQGVPVGTPWVGTSGYRIVRMPPGGDDAGP